MAILPNPFSELDESRDRFVPIAERYVDSESAKDVVQNCFLKLLEKKNGEAVPTGFFVQMIKHEAISFLRREKRNYSQRTNVEFDTESADIPECTLEASELKEAACAFKSELPEVQAMLIEKRFTEGLSFAETARLSGMTTQGLRYHFNRICSAGQMRFRDWENC